MTSMEKGISIIVPVYNCEDYLKECLDGLLVQDIDDYEIILVDDESKDSSGEICDFYAERFDNVRVIHQKNSGPGGARNAGMDVARGKYILFVDSDDVVEQNCLGKIQRTAEANELDLLIIARDIFTDDERTIINFKYVFKPTFGVNSVVSGIEFLKRGLETNEYYPMVTFKLYRKEYLIENSIRFMPNIIHEDDGFMFRATIRAKKVMSLEDQFYHYRMQGSSIMHTLVAEKRAEGFCSAIAQIGEVLEEVEGEWESSTEAYLVLRYIDMLAQNALVNYMLSDKESRIRSRGQYSCLLDRSKRYYKGLRFKVRLYAKDPYRIAPYYRAYRKIRKSLKSVMA